MKKFFLFLNIKIVLLITIFSLFYFLVIFIYDLCFYELSKNLKKCVVSKPEEYHQSARSSAKKWMNDLKKDDRKTCLQVAHAEGALHVKNALLIIPEHFRSSIIVVKVFIIYLGKILLHFSTKKFGKNFLINSLGLDY
jgi:hypothetical protein